VEQVDVAIVGGGLLGSATARALAARGVQTVLFEQFGPDHDRGSSHGATRIFRLSYPDPVYVRMAVAAHRLWTDLADEAGEQLLVPTGGLDAGPDAGACAAALAECGVQHTWLTAGDMREQFPGIAMRPDERMLLQPDAGATLAGRSVAALQRLARRDGADIRTQTPVLGVQVKDDRAVLQTAAGELSAAVVVIAAGGWAAGLLNGALPHPPKLTATLQRVRYFAPREPGSAWPTLIEWIPAGMTWYVVPQAGGAPGIKVASHDRGPVVDPAAGPFTDIDPVAEERAARYVRDRMPGLDPVGLDPETCLYTMTPDEHFVLDREGPVVVGGGGSGHAFKFGPLLGEKLADLAQGRDTGLPRRHFALSRPGLAD
jgi:sarcosine oxidase